MSLKRVSGLLYLITLTLSFILSPQVIYAQGGNFPPNELNISPSSINKDQTVAISVSGCPPGEEITYMWWKSEDKAKLEAIESAITNARTRAANGEEADDVFGDMWEAIDDAEDDLPDPDYHDDNSTQITKGGDGASDEDYFSADSEDKDTFFLITAACNDDGQSNIPLAPPELLTVGSEENPAITQPPPPNPCPQEFLITDPRDGIVNSCGMVQTAIGRIPTTPEAFIQRIFSIVLGLAGGIALLLIIYSGYELMTSSGNQEKVQHARERLTAAIVGVIFIIFSLFILSVIGVDILRIPGFS